MLSFEMHSWKNIAVLAQNCPRVLFSKRWQSWEISSGWFEISPGTRHLSAEDLTPGKFRINHFAYRGQLYQELVQICRCCQFRIINELLGNFQNSNLASQLFVWMKNTTRSSKDEYTTGDQTIILGLHIFLIDHWVQYIKRFWRYCPSLHPPFYDLGSSLEVVWMFSESYSSSLCLLIFLPFLSICPSKSLLVHICSY